MITTVYLQTKNNPCIYTKKAYLPPIGSLYQSSYGSEMGAWVDAYLAGSSSISADLKVNVDHDGDVSEHNENNNEFNTSISSF